MQDRQHIVIFLAHKVLPISHMFLNKIPVKQKKCFLLMPLLVPICYLLQWCQHEVHKVLNISSSNFFSRFRSLRKDFKRQVERDRQLQINVCWRMRIE